MQFSIKGSDFLSFVSESDEDHEKTSFTFPFALFEAITEVNKGREAFLDTLEMKKTAIAKRFTKNPDRRVVEEWLRGRGAASSDLEVIYWLCVHVLSAWESLPKMTVSAHRNVFGEIEQTANKLAELIESTNSDYYRGGGYGLRNAFVCDLFTNREEGEILQPLEDAAAEQDPEAPPITNARFIFPTVEDLLSRIAEAANRLTQAGPIHSQPNKRGALNGYFVRRIHALLTQRYDEAPTRILSAIATLALDEVIDDDLAAKHTKLSERCKAK